MELIGAINNAANYPYAYDDPTPIDPGIFDWTLPGLDENEPDLIDPYAGMDEHDLRPRMSVPFLPGTEDPGPSDSASIGPGASTSDGTTACPKETPGGDVPLCES
ncbi:MAG TPA: hypothetical protein VHI77_08010 [Solirubrobacterales bacterium]|jgi:hypothetical protein|nr:hypothetical protein [Solirubrobacterales bacterium]